MVEQGCSAKHNSKARNYSKKYNYCCLVVYDWYNSWNLEKISLHNLIVINFMFSIKKLKQKRPALVNCSCPLLLYNNTRPHVAKLTLQKLQDLGVTKLNLIHLIPHIYLLHIVIFSYPWTTSYEIRRSTIEMSKTHFPLLSKILIWNKIVKRWESVIDKNGDYFD